jgi:patatin-like phospholipase/acyl hydrolase
VLALDGGGIRGVIPAMVLAEIERRCNKRIADLFDLIAGTSTGGILALGLTAPDPADPKRARYRADDLVQLYTSKGDVIFHRSFLHWLLTLGGLLGSKYTVTGLDATLHTYFGESRMKEAVCEVLITSYDLESRDAWFIARYKAQQEPSYDFPMTHVARATSAAPTYFRPEQLSERPPSAMVDGGVFANNPAMCAYVEAIKLHGQGDILLVSLGTGQSKSSIHFWQARTWGLIGWARRLIDVFMDGVADTVEHQLSFLLPERDGQLRYFRFQTSLPTGMGAMDNANPDHIAALKQQAQQLIDSESTKFDQLCALLVATA